MEIRMLGMHVHLGCIWSVLIIKVEIQLIRRPFKNVWKSHRLIFSLAGIFALSLWLAIEITELIEKFFDINELVLKCLLVFLCQFLWLRASYHGCELLEIICRIGGKLDKLVDLWVKDAEVGLDIAKDGQFVQLANNVLGALTFGVSLLDRVRDDRNLPISRLQHLLDQI